MKRVWSIVFTIAIIGLLVYVLRDINLYEVYLLISQANLIWFGLSFLSVAATFVVWNYRWYYILKPYLKVDYWYFMQVLLAGAFFNTVTPGGGIGGEPFRAHYLSLKYKKPRARILGYIIGDTFFRLAVLAVFVVFSILFLLIYVNIPESLKIILEIILAAVLVSAAIVSYLTLKKFKFNIGALFKKLHTFKFFRDRFETADHLVEFVNKKIRSFSKVFRKVVKNKRNAFIGIPLSILFWGFNYLSAYFLFLSFGVEVNFLSVIIVFTLSIIIGSFSPGPGGVGVTESSMILLYSAVGVPISAALLVSFLQRIIYYFFSIFIGGISMIKLRNKNNKGSIF